MEVFCSNNVFRINTCIPTLFISEECKRQESKAIENRCNLPFDFKKVEYLIGRDNLSYLIPLI